MDRKLTLSHHVTQLTIRLRAGYKKLEWLFGKRSKLSKVCKTVVYKQLLAPIWHYALPIWHPLTSNTQVHRIEVIQNKMLRKITKAPWFTKNQTLRDRYNIKSAGEVLEHSSDRLANSLLKHPNEEARKLISHPYVPQRLNRPKYTEQLRKYILPLQRQLLQQQQQQQHVHPQPTHNIRLPTLIRIQNEIDSVRQAERRASAPRHPFFTQTRPEERIGIRFDELTINNLRRRYRDGQITRQRLAEIIQHQPAIIQELILPEQRAVRLNQQSAQRPTNVEIQQVSIPATTQSSLTLPPLEPRFSCTHINQLRRRYLRGLLPREFLLRLTQEQPRVVQELIMPELRLERLARQRIELANTVAEQQLAQNLENLQVQLELDLIEVLSSD